MPYPIRKTREQMTDHNVAQDFSSLIPFVKNPYELLQSIVFNDRDKEIIKNIWLTSEVNQNDKSITVSSSVTLRDLEELRMKGLINYIDRNKNIVSLTDKGSKLLRESILNDEHSSFTKKASKQLVMQNSYDFGDEILVKTNDPEKFGARYIAIAKNKLKKDAVAKTINNYDNISVRKASGEYKDISDYSDDELIAVLHLAKKIIANQHNIIVSGKHLEHVPINRIKSFAELIMKELNAR